MTSLPLSSNLYFILSTTLGLVTADLHCLEIRKGMKLGHQDYFMNYVDLIGYHYKKILGLRTRGSQAQVLS
jgi:hypothetical protein